MSSELAIAARDVGKAYKIYRRPEDRLKQMFFRSRRYFEEYWAVQGVDLEVAPGETVGIIGRNGSGKSTLLQLICGTIEPTSGRVETQGRIAALLELGSGFNPEFTGRENVYLAASILGLTTKEIEDRYPAIVEFAGIGDFLEQPAKTYSSGMYARLAFAVAAHVDADILVVDEILAVGDAGFNQKCMRYIRRFKQNGTLLFVSHDVGSVVNLCDRAVWLDTGIVRESGPAKEVCHDYMAALESEGDGADAFRTGGRQKRAAAVHRPTRDVRQRMLAEVSGRNNVQVFDFDPDAPWFGRRGATVVGVALLSAKDEAVTTLEGGEEVVLQIRCEAHRALCSPIVGFYVKDRLGQSLFGDNTYLMYRDSPLTVNPGQSVVALFRFQLPYLAAGEYSITVGIAEGTQDDHVQQHWIDDAMFFRVISSPVLRGLMGIPMLGLELFVTGTPKVSAAVLDNG
jgi:lipopolysaccharide transport system ATP-binding protein